MCVQDPFSQIRSHLYNHLYIDCVDYIFVPTGVTYQHHVEQLAPSVKKLAELEREVQTNFLRNQHLIA